MNKQTEREALVSQATHSALLEGLKVSPAFQKNSDEYIAGTITADQLVELTRERLGLGTAGRPLS